MQTARLRLELGLLLAMCASLSMVSPVHAWDTRDTFANGDKSMFSFEWHSGLVIVPVRINGSTALSFVLDTGSTRMLIDRRIARDLGLRTSGTGTLQGAGAGQIPIEFIQDISLDLPGVKSAGYEFSTADLQSLQESVGTKVDGILGYEFFRRFVVTIDYERKELIVTRPDAFHSGEAAQALPIELKNKWAFVKAEIALPGPVTVQDSFLIDSGSSDAVDHPIVMKLESRKSTTSGVGLGSPVEGATAQATALRLGRYEVKGPTVACCGGAEATSKLVGSDVLRFFTVNF